MIVQTDRFIIDTDSKFVVRTGRSDFHTLLLVSTKRDGKPFHTFAYIMALETELPAAFQKRAQLLLDVLEAGQQTLLAERKTGVE